MPMAGSLTPFGYSPDGSLMALHTGSLDGVIIADARTGAERARLTLPGELVGWYDNTHLAAYSPMDGRRHEGPAHLHVVDLSGATTASHQVRYQLAKDKVLGTVRR